MDQGKYQISLFLHFLKPSLEVFIFIIENWDNKESVKKKINITFNSSTQRSTPLTRGTFFF